MKTGANMDYIYESENIHFFVFYNKYKLDYINMYLNEKIW